MADKNAFIAQVYNAISRSLAIMWFAKAARIDEIYPVTIFAVLFMRMPKQCDITAVVFCGLIEAVKAIFNILIVTVSDKYLVMRRCYYPRKLFTRAKITVTRNLNYLFIRIEIKHIFNIVKAVTAEDIHIGIVLSSFKEVMHTVASSV